MNRLNCTNHILFLQQVRFGEHVQKLCVNKMAVRNTLFKKSKNNPKATVRNALRLVARGVLYRMATMFLYSNEEEINKAMTTNANGIHSDAIKSYRKKMSQILRILYPHGQETTRKQLLQMELWMGHDLLAQTIVLNSRAAATQPENIFSRNIPEMQWDDYVKKEKRDKRRTPLLEAKYKTYPLPSERKQKPLPQTRIAEVQRDSENSDADYGDDEISKLIGISKLRCVHDF